ncbi:cysteine desulfurase family protein [Virgibacillus sp. LDC-1]|uniref:cysteine desulfurase family protein n=1 Tax=Virgibacillus sp. LDC-1 TaxID=3039856 RepID=UPI0024DEEBE5|nr:cysteine desulfurase family protein [Virgibacillus sp. LDC-1]
METIYLDHAATTPIDPAVIEAMLPLMSDVFGNPSSVHSYGRKARQSLDEARRTIAQRIHAHEKEVTFTSGGTEADNLALIGTALANKDRGKHIITTVQEHHATLHTAEYLEREGFEVTYLPVDENGVIKVEDVREALTAETILVSVMYVNNETGTIQPIQEIGDLLKEHQAYFHTDAVQAFGLLEIDVKKMGIDLLTATAHKINGPKGIGLLYAGKHVKLQPLAYGGEQERKRRPGTENVANVVGFQKAVELRTNKEAEYRNLYQAYKELFIQTLQEEGIAFEVNGKLENTIPSIINISFPHMNVESLLVNFDLNGVAASSGSACTAGSIEPSHVLVAMYGANNERTKNAVRFSFGSANTKENVKEAAERVAGIVKRMMKNR